MANAHAILRFTSSLPVDQTDSDEVNYNAMSKQLVAEYDEALAWIKKISISLEEYFQVSYKNEIAEAKTLIAKAEAK